MTAGRVSDPTSSTADLNPLYLLDSTWNLCLRYSKRGNTLKEVLGEGESVFGVTPHGAKFGLAAFYAS